jgi:hypothetical protein
MPPQPVKGTALLLYMEMMFVPHRKHNEPLRPVTEIALLLLLIFYFTLTIVLNMGARRSVVVKALCYKAEGRGFETR